MNVCRDNPGLGLCADCDNRPPLPARSKNLAFGRCPELFIEFRLIDFRPRYLPPGPIPPRPRLGSSLSGALIISGGPFTSVC
jgi:hypothetical protein